jgi:4-diphosphocytidyl-2-C-methyl-D-erythritol kinase
MFIESISVAHFGKLHGLQLDFCEGFNLIEGKNESGKSTIAAFIRYMLYGFSSPSDKRRYVSWESSSAEGSMTVSALDGRKYRIDKKTLLVSTSSGKDQYRETSSITDLESNTLTKAYARYAAATGFAPAVDVELIKGIPHGAGLGGGSADGAEVLAWLQRQNPEPLPAQELNALAARVGADVPFFLKRGSCMAEGIGDELSPAETGLEGWHCVLVCPRVHVDTAWAYAAWDAENPSFSLTEKRKADKNNRSIYAFFYGMNDFEAVVFSEYPVLPALKSQLIQQGADIAGMSGSGSALFGLFRDGDTAALAAKALENAEGAPAVYGPFLL